MLVYKGKFCGIVRREKIKFVGRVGIKFVSQKNMVVMVETQNNVFCGEGKSY